MPYASPLAPVGPAPASCWHDRCFGELMTATTWHRAAGALSFVAVVSSSAIGCSQGADGETEEVASSESSALHSSLKCDVSNLGTQACRDALTSVGLQAYAAGRSEIVERGLGWLNVGVIYKGHGSYQGYRTDCSGFISMCWQYGANPGTALFPPFDKTGPYAVALGSFDDLVPGDAVNRRTRIKNREGVAVGHVMLFAGWASFDRQEMFFIHESAPGRPTALIRASRRSIGDFIPIRASNAPAPIAPAADLDPPPAPEPGTPAQPGCGKLMAGQSLGIGEGLKSCDGRFTLSQQSDGRLVLSDDGERELWSTPTAGSDGRTTVMQGDGNLVVYGTSGANWSSQTHNHPGAWLALNDDGSLVVDDANGKPIWWDGTGGR